MKDKDTLDEIKAAMEEWERKNVTSF